MGPKKSLVIGPRTRKNILEGRNIRKDKDGCDLFEDYWTDSDDESSASSRKCNSTINPQVNSNNDSSNLAIEEQHATLIITTPNTNLQLSKSNIAKIKDPAPLSKIQINKSSLLLKEVSEISRNSKKSIMATKTKMQTEMEKILPHYDEMDLQIMEMYHGKDSIADKTEVSQTPQKSLNESNANQQLLEHSKNINAKTVINEENKNLDESQSEPEDECDLELFAEKLGIAPSSASSSPSKHHMSTRKTVPSNISSITDVMTSADKHVSIRKSATFNISSVTSAKKSPCKRISARKSISPNISNITSTMKSPSKHNMSTRQSASSNISSVTDMNSPRKSVIASPKSTSFNISTRSKKHDISKRKLDFSNIESVTDTTKSPSKRRMSIKKSAPSKISSVTDINSQNKDDIPTTESTSRNILNGTKISASKRCISTRKLVCPNIASITDTTKSPSKHRMSTKNLAPSNISDVIDVNSSNKGDIHASELTSNISQGTTHTETSPSKKHISARKSASPNLSNEASESNSNVHVSATAGPSRIMNASGRINLGLHFNAATNFSGVSNVNNKTCSHVNVAINASKAPIVTDEINPNSPVDTANSSDHNQSRDDPYEFVDNSFTQKTSKKREKAISKQTESDQIHSTQKQKKKKRRLSEKSRNASNDRENDGSEKIRRSTRQRYPPLDSWRGERLCYERVNEELKLYVEKGTSFDDKPYQFLHKRAERHYIKKKTKIHKPKKANLCDVEGKKKCLANVVKNFSLIPWLTPSNESEKDQHPYQVKRMFETQKTAFGFVQIEIDKEKPQQYQPDDDLMLTVVRGQVEITIQKNCYSITEKDMCFIPKGCAYSIKNIGKVKATLSFAVGKFHFLESLNA